MTSINNIFDSMKIKNNQKTINIIFWIILIASVLVVFGPFVFGQKYYVYIDVGADTYQQYYPYYINEVLRIRSGTFDVWNWTYGMGTGIINNVAWSFDPYAIVLVLLGVVIGPNAVKYLIVYMQIAKIITAYILTKKYLRYFIEDIYAINTAAFISAFNGYLLLWGQHYFLGTAYIMLLLNLLAIEKFIQSDCKQGGILLSASIAVTLIYSYYIGYMILITIAPYAVYRCYAAYWKKSPKKFGRITAKGSLQVVIGIMLAGIVFIPASYNIITNSSRIDASANGIISKIVATFKTNINFDVVGLKLSRMISNNALYVNNVSDDNYINYYEDPQLFISIFILFAITFWIVFECRKIKQTSGKYYGLIIKSIFILLLIFSRFTGLVYNMFSANTFRYTFVIIPFLCIYFGMFIQELQNAKPDYIWPLLISSIATLIVGIYMAINSAGEVKLYILFIGIEVFIGILLLVGLIDNKERRKLFLCFVMLVLFSTTVDGFVTTNYRNRASKEIMPSFTEEDQVDNDTGKALKWINKQDNSIYRVGKTYYDWGIQMDSFVELYSTPSEYNSTVNKNVDDFYHEIYTNACNVVARYNFSCSDELDNKALDITNTKYILSREPVTISGWEKIKNIGDIDIYKKANSSSLAKVYGNTIEESDFKKLERDEKSIALENSAVVVENIDGIDKNTIMRENSFQMKSQTQIVGLVDSSGGGVLMLSIPYQEGWKVYIDGKEQDLFRCNYGFIGLKITEGKHDILIHYNIPMLNVGIAMSATGLIILVLLYWYNNRQRKIEENQRYEIQI